MISRERKSPFIKLFAGTPPGIICPHFYILSHANGCPYACQYCYLHLTLRHTREPVVFTNLADLQAELNEFLSSMIPTVTNCGALSDGLAWDDLTRFSRTVVPIYARQSTHTLVFVTKSTNIGNLLEMEPTSQAVVSFSVNAEEVAQRYESKAPTPGERLEAATQLKRAGWRVRLRLDPLIPVKGWRDAYGRLAERINALGPEMVTLLGLFYFPAAVNFTPKGSDVFSFATEQTVDRRMRIPHGQRQEMFRFLLERLNAPKVGLCKETVEMYRELGWDTENVTCNCGTA